MKSKLRLNNISGLDDSTRVAILETALAETVESYALYRLSQHFASYDPRMIDTIRNDYNDAIYEAAAQFGLGLPTMPEEW